MKTCVELNLILNLVWGRHVVSKMLKMLGHVVCCFSTTDLLTFSDPPLFATFSPSNIKMEIEKGQKISL